MAYILYSNFIIFLGMFLITTGTESMSKTFYQRANSTSDKEKNQNY